MSRLVRPRQRTSPQLTPPERPRRLPRKPAKGQADPPDATSAIVLPAKKRGPGGSGCQATSKTPDPRGTAPGAHLPAAGSGARTQDKRSPATPTASQPSHPGQGHPGDLAATTAPSPEL